MYYKELTREPWSTVPNVTNLNSQNEWEPLTSSLEETDGTSPVRRMKVNKRVFALGNGESRKGLNLNDFYEFGIIYGCNALYRDFRPDALVVVDPAMKEEIWETDYLLENKAFFKDWTSESPIHPDDWGFRATPAYLYKRLGADDSPKRVVNSNDVIKGRFPDDAIRTGYASGPSSVLISCIEEEPDEVYLIGHDLYSKNDKFNNIYKDTKNYMGSLSDPTPPDNWISQLKRTFEDFGLVQFYIVDSLKEKIEEWKDLVNIHPITLDEMWKRLNR